jgi:hypothetical protein
VDCIGLDATLKGSVDSMGQSVAVLFAFEYVILLIDVTRTFLK